MKSVIITLLLALGMHGQSITWTKAWTGDSAGATGAFYNGYHDIHYDSYSNKTYLDTTNISSTVNQIFIYSDRFAQFNTSDSSYTLLATNGQTTTNGCNTSLDAPNGADTYHTTYHPVGQEFLDTKRHRIWSWTGVSGSWSGIDMWYNQLSMSGGAANWTLVAQNANTDGSGSQPWTLYANVNTSLSAAISSTDTTMSLSSISNVFNGMYIILSGNEVVRVTGSGGRPCGGGAAAVNPLTIARHQLGTVARGHGQNDTAKGYLGAHNAATISFDPDDDVFFMLGGPTGIAQYEYMWCDTSQNITPGTLSAAQTAAGCTLADGWTNMTANTLCTDNACIATAGSGVTQKGVPTGATYPNMVWDTANHRFMTYGGMSGSSTIVNQVWFYNVGTKTWTPRTAGLAKISDTFTTVDCTTASSTISPTNNGKYACTPSVNTTLTINAGSTNDIISVKLCQGSGIKTVTWSGATNPPYTPNKTSGSGVNCTLASFRYNGSTWNNINPPNSSNNTEGGRVAHAWDSGINVYRYHQTQNGIGDSQTPSAPPQDWIYDPSTDSWTQLSLGSCSTTTQTCGPYETETMTYDSSANALVVWAQHLDNTGKVVAGTPEIWVGSLFTPVRVQQSGNAVFSGRATH